ncbi:hypothetical protein C1886_12190 [Pseudomonas sp. FW300-N1A1]|nr:hypothetical protein C1886_12190 [Pseudomonas sp. FW300-N1A1]
MPLSNVLRFEGTFPSATLLKLPILVESLDFGCFDEIDTFVSVRRLGLTHSADFSAERLDGAQSSNLILLVLKPDRGMAQS